MATPEEIQQFMAITSSDEQTAKSHLSTAGNDVLAAVEQYFAHAALLQKREQETTRPRASSGTSGSRSSQARNVRSLSDYSDLEEADESEHNEYYAGGEKSGQVVRGAPKPGARDVDDVEGVFEAAQAAGARQGTASDMPAVQGRPRFAGLGRTLAGGVAGPSTSQGGALAVRTVAIYFYRNGYFRVDDGEGRAMADPANADFMQAIMRGQCPAELEPADPSQPVNVNLLRKDEDWVEAEATQGRAFTGQANRLGGETAPDPAPVAAAAPAPSQPAPGGGAWEGPDASAPTTSIQLRLSDGGRLVAKFNLTHTVGDIKRFLRTARPDLGPGLQLATAFPAARLEDDGLSIEQAGLANAVVIQKAA